MVRYFFFSHFHKQILFNLENLKAFETQDIGLCFNTKHKILYFLEIFSLIFPNILGILLELKKWLSWPLKIFL